MATKKVPLASKKVKTKLDTPKEMMKRVPVKKGNNKEVSKIIKKVK